MVVGGTSWILRQPNMVAIKLSQCALTDLDATCLVWIQGRPKSIVEMKDPEKGPPPKKKEHHIDNDP